MSSAQFTRFLTLKFLPPQNFTSTDRSSRTCSLSMVDLRGCEVCSVRLTTVDDFHFSFKFSIWSCAAVLTLVLFELFAWSRSTLVIKLEARSSFQFIRVPKFFPHLTQKRVLTMKLMVGENPTDLLLVSARESADRYVQNFRKGEARCQAKSS